jgi:cell division protein FtsL
MNYAMYSDNRMNTSQTRRVSHLLSSHTFRVFLTIFTLILLIVYVVRLSTVSIKGYDISALQKQVKTLQDDDNKLQFEIAKNGSMQNIQERLKNVQFVPVEKPEFASLQPPVVAVK